MLLTLVSAPQSTPPGLQGPPLPCHLPVRLTKCAELRLQLPLLMPQLTPERIQRCMRQWLLPSTCCCCLLRLPWQSDAHALCCAAHEGVPRCDVAGVGVCCCLKVAELLLRLWTHQTALLMTVNDAQT